MRAPAAHRPDVAGRGTQRHLEQRHVELGVMGQDADHGAFVHALPGQVPVRPVGHDLVSVGEAPAGREHRPRVADRHPVAEELAGPGHGGREVDRAEDQHPRRRSERLDEHRQLVPSPLAVRAVPADTGQALREHPARVVVHRLVQPLPGAERA